MVAISDTLWESLPCLRSSAGFMVSMTNTESMAILETTTRSSINVNPVRGRPRLRASATGTLGRPVSNGMKEERSI